MGFGLIHAAFQIPGRQLEDVVRLEPRWSRAESPWSQTEDKNGDVLDVKMAHFMKFHDFMMNFM